MLEAGRISHKGASYFFCGIAAHFLLRKACVWIWTGGVESGTSISVLPSEGMLTVWRGVMLKAVKGTLE